MQEVQNQVGPLLRSVVGPSSPQQQSMDLYPFNVTPGLESAGLLFRSTGGS